MILEIMRQLKMQHEHLERDSMVEGWPDRLKDHVASQYRLMIQLSEEIVKLTRRVDTWQQETD